VPRGGYRCAFCDREHCNVFATVPDDHGLASYQDTYAPVIAFVTIISCTHMSIPIPSQKMFKMIPRTANIEYKPLKILGEGKDGDVVLAIPRSGNQNLDSCVALKMLRGDNVTSVAKRLLKQLQGMESKADHIIAAVLKFPESSHPGWHSMHYIPGCSIQQLLDKKYDENGLPPTIVLHVLAELVRVQDHLETDHLTHADLAAGGNVMLSNKGRDAWPSVTLVDFSGIVSYNEVKKLEHVLQLVANMTRNQKAIPDRWRLDTFQDKDVEITEGIYTICGRRRLSEDKRELGGLWKIWKETTIGLKQNLRDEDALQDLKNELDSATITKQDLERMVKTPEVDMTEEPFDAAS
jgi:serine/threonine protein kinase